MAEPVIAASLSRTLDEVPDEIQSAEPSPAEQNLRVPRIPQIGSFVILLLGGIYFARDFLLPVIVALLFALTLSPIVRFLARRGIPASLSSFVIMSTVVFSIGAGIYLLSAPVTEWIDDIPRLGQQIKTRVADLRKPVDAVVEATKQVDEATSTQDNDPMVQQVVVKQPGLLSSAVSNLGSIVTTSAVTLILMFFLLASGNLFYEKAIRAVPSFSDKKRVLRVIYDIEHEVSAYLFTVMLINCGLGAVIALGMFVLGMPSFYLWGAAAALLNFIPYIGAIIGIGIVAAVALVSFPTLAHAALIPAFYLFATVIEGQFITPLLLGRRLELNAVAIFVAVALWTWLWGFVGAFIAVPLLVMVKVFCDHFESLSAFGEFLSAQRPAQIEDAE